jgi:hypothetical protein
MARVLNELLEKTRKLHTQKSTDTSTRKETVRRIQAETPASRKEGEKHETEVEKGYERS